MAKGLGINENVLYRWIRQYREDPENSFPGKGKLKSEDEELRLLRRELADVKEERDIVKKSCKHLLKTPVMKYKFIIENRKEFRVGKMCKVLNVSRSGYHNYVKRRYSRRENDEIIILEKIKEIHKKSRELYGSPRIYQELRKGGLKINKKRVVRIMQKYGIRAKTKGKFKKTTNSNYNNPIAKDLLGQNFKSRKSNKIWVSDKTYIRTREGWLYLSCILDLYSRMIVGWKIDRRQTSSSYYLSVIFGASKL